MAAPLAVNLAVWALLVAPAQRRVAASRSARSLLELKPQLESLLRRSNQLLMSWDRTVRTGDDPAASTALLERLADQHHLQLTKLSGRQSRSEGTGASASTMPVELEVVGRFSKLARWLGDVEAQPGLRIESWNMTPGGQFGGPAHATVKLSTMGGALGPPAVSAKSSTERYEQTADELAQAVHTAQALEEQAGGYDAVFSRDPLKALIDAQGRVVSATGFSGGLAVQGIMWSQERPLAVVDDELYATGDSVGPYTIVEIWQEGVVVARDGATLFVPLDRGVGLPPPE